MAVERLTMTRATSADSSAESNIELETSAEDSGEDQAPASTPPTSMSDNTSVKSAKAAESSVQASEEAESPRRPKRARASISYNVKELLDKQLPLAGGYVATGAASRNSSGLSGRTLVNRTSQEDAQVLSMGAEYAERRRQKESTAASHSPNGRASDQVQRKPSVKDRSRSMLNSAKSAAQSAGSVLGKRTRDMVEKGIDKGKRALGMTTEEEQEEEGEEEEEEVPKILKELDMGVGSVWDNIPDIDPEDYDRPPPRPAKKQKTVANATGLQDISQPSAPTGPLQKMSDGQKVKKWEFEGLFVGQEADTTREEAAKKGKKLQKKRPGTASSQDGAPPKKKPRMPLPMFGYLDKNRDFTIPYDVFAPSLRKGDERPKDWTKVNRNRVVGDAKDLWNVGLKKGEHSLCLCQPPQVDGDVGCDETCLNRVMQYECNDENCALDAATCSNRPFAEIDRRLKKGGQFDIGVEVVKTEKRGFGIRATRSFRPDQIIMEYTGEIISEGECQRRMRELYKDKANYYLMELERGLVIDGTKGSMARFINHACEPNCIVQMFKVNGVPRMGVFAGKSGIMTGEELTYDYNFDNFGDHKQPCYCGTPNCRGHLGPKLSAADEKKQKKLEAERRRVAAEEAEKARQEAERKKRTAAERPTGWIGWKTLDDPDVKAELMRRKREEEEKARNDPRARRLAARRGEQIAAASAAAASTSKPASKQETPVQEAPKPSSAKRALAEKKEPDLKRRKTVAAVPRFSNLSKSPGPSTKEAKAIRRPMFPNLGPGPKLGTESPRRPTFPNLGPGSTEERRSTFQNLGFESVKGDFSQSLPGFSARSPFRKKKFIPSNFPKESDNSGIAIQVAAQLSRSNSVATGERPNSAAPTLPNGVDGSDSTIMSRPATSTGYLRRTSTGSRFTEDLEAEQRPRSSRPKSGHSHRNSISGIIKRTTVSVKSSVEMARQNTIEENVIMTDDAILMKEMTMSQGRSLSKISSNGVDEDAEQGAMEVEESEVEQEEVELEVNPKRKSFIEAAASTMSSAVKSGGKVLGFGGGGGNLKQTKLNFGRKA